MATTIACAAEKGPAFAVCVLLLIRLTDARVPSSPVGALNPPLPPPPPPDIPPAATLPLSPVAPGANKDVFFPCSSFCLVPSFLSPATPSSSSW